MSTRDVIMPMFVVMDTSGSMNTIDEGNQKKRIEIAYSIIPSLLDAMDGNATIKESLRVSVIGFNDRVTQHLISADYDHLNKWYESSKQSYLSSCGGQTYYGVMFSELKQIISDTLNAPGVQYYRPLVYFLTDGYPYGEKENPDVTLKNYLALVDNKEKPENNPVIFCIGIGDANEETLKRFGAGRVRVPSGEYKYHNGNMAFVIRKGIQTGPGLLNFNEEIINTITRSFNNRANISKTGRLELSDMDFELKPEEFKRRFESIFDRA